MMFELNGNLITEDVDGDLLVCDASRSLVHRLNGDTAELVRSMRTAPLTSIDISESDGLERLLELGIIIESQNVANGPLTALAGRTLSRRKVMGMTAAAATAGIVTLALPEAAAAASAPGGGGSEPLVIDPDTFDITTPTQFQWSNRRGELKILWEPIPAVFTYTWTVRSGSHSGPVLATGSLTASYSASGILFTASPGQTVYITATANTSPVTTNQTVLSRN